MTETRRIALSTGVTLNVALAGREDAPPVILLHGFPESYRTWRGVVPMLEDRFRLVMPDLRGFGASDQPQDLESYATDKLVADIFALADAVAVDRFALVGHDWGGATAWAAAIRGSPRVERLAIINSPHPLVFQRSLIEDAEQRAASQYINAFRIPGFERSIETMGYNKFFAKSFTTHVELAAIPAEERARYVGDWSRPGAMTAMFNWY
ncbi:MAG TPA: alpha/beta fold hydrolase, partial [Sphingomicrobium sp.]|nr:alpha/beta fold hydrolase [Sphingomicrobium sp.]